MINVCTGPGIKIPVPLDPQTRTVAFEGPHPAGLVGTHIHFLEPVDQHRCVWYLGYQDVIAIGRLFTTGRLWVERVVSIAGSPFSRPRLIRTRLGACIADLTRHELKYSQCRLISGSWLGGRAASAAVGYLGRYHNQVCALANPRPSRFLEWLRPRRRKLEWSTGQHGRTMAMLPIGSFERVMPLDILPTPLLKALLIRDLDTAVKLGCLELEEEDLALCSHVCCSKQDYGVALRDCLDPPAQGIVMGSLHDLLDRLRPRFYGARRYQHFGPIFSLIENCLCPSNPATRGAPHIRDALSSQLVFARWCMALSPCVLFALWNTGYQANLLIETHDLSLQEGWRTGLLLGLAIDLQSGVAWTCVVHGLLYFLPLLLTTLFVAVFWEGVFAIVRRRAMDEGFVLTCLLFTLTLPPGLPLWQAAVGISFGIVIAKQVFGGTGNNFFNPALAGRAFLYFAYPAEISGNGRWIAVDGHTSATSLTLASDDGLAGIAQSGISWSDALLGAIPGSLGETSILACLFGAVILLVLRLASWRIMLGSLFGMIVASLIFNFIGNAQNPLWAVPWHWHLVLGGFVFGTVFMATDPVTSSQTDSGRWFYGALIGMLTILIRVTNPLFPEGIMMAILFANVCAPLIDHFVITANIRRRQRRYDRKRC